MTYVRLLRRTAAGGLVLLAFACGDRAAPAATSTSVEDGVPVVSNTGSGDAVSGWRLREVYAVGLRDDEPTFEFITTAKVRDDGSVLVADANGGQVYILNADGTVRHRVGREGEGPGEYTWLDGAVWGGGDTVVVQSAGGRLTTFDGPELVSARRVDWGFRWNGNVSMQIADRRPDGSTIYVQGGTSPRGAGEWMPSAVLRMSADLETVDTLRIHDGWFDARLDDRNPLRRWGGAWPTASGFVVARNDVPEVTWYDAEGSPVRIARWDHAPREMTERAIDDYARAQVERGSRELTDEALNRMIADQRAAVDGPIPIWRRLLATPDGTVWLTDFGAHPLDFGNRAHVIAPDGTWLGSIRTRPNTILMDVTDRWVVGVEFSPLDIQSVVLWEIVRD